MRRPTLAAVMCAGVVTLAAGCATTEHMHAQGGGVHLDQITHAIAVLSPTQGNSARGTVTFVQSGSQVTVTANLSGLGPNTTHAWHVHEWGDISAPDGTAAGGHYNPEGHLHGLPEQSARHAGDFGNLMADANGNAKKTITVDNITIGGPKNPVLGRGIIIHADPDDGGQPTGNAGARIAQGVIGVQKPG